MGTPGEVFLAAEVVVAGVLPLVEVEDTSVQSSEVTLVEGEDFQAVAAAREDFQAEEDFQAVATAGVAEVATVAEVSDFKNTERTWNIIYFDTA